MRRGDRDVIINGQKVTITERDEAHGLVAQRDFGGTKKWRTCYVSDGTGHAMLQTMSDQAIGAAIPVHERTEAIALIHDAGRCYGAIVRDLVTGEIDGAGMRIAVVCGRFNDLITNRLLDGALAGLAGVIGGNYQVTEPGMAAATSLGAYPTFNFHVAAGGGRPVRVPYRNVRQDLDALLAAAVREDAHILYVATPENPMGSVPAAADLRELIARLPDGRSIVQPPSPGSATNLASPEKICSSADTTST